MTARGWPTTLPNFPIGESSRVVICGQDLLTRPSEAKPKVTFVANPPCVSEQKKQLWAEADEIYGTYSGWPLLLFGSCFVRT